MSLNLGWHTRRQNPVKRPSGIFMALSQEGKSIPEAHLDLR